MKKNAKQDSQSFRIHEFQVTLCRLRFTCEVYATIQCTLSDLTTVVSALLTSMYVCSSSSICGIDISKLAYSSKVRFFLAA
uniref:Uncharacterized protein n=1 Tax=Arabidopsis thaliana TaxID=3702 RepID=Q8GXM2_ARATH|nr:unknown protein [Arabidopsis thaliana]